MDPDNPLFLLLEATKEDLGMCIHFKNEWEWKWISPMCVSFALQQTWIGIKNEYPPEENSFIFLSFSIHFHRSQKEPLNCLYRVCYMRKKQESEQWSLCTFLIAYEMDPLCSLCLKLAGQNHLRGHRMFAKKVIENKEVSHKRSPLLPLKAMEIWHYVNLC